MGDKVWVLTCEYNEYDQHGAYFVGVFAKKPDVGRLEEELQRSSPSWQWSADVAASAKHLSEGGGRMGEEDSWYNLEEVELW